MAETGVTSQPGDAVPIDSKGEATLLVGLDSTIERAQVLLDIDGVMTALRLQNVPLWAVEKKEKANAGGNQ